MNGVHALNPSPDVDFDAVIDRVRNEHTNLTAEEAAIAASGYRNALAILGCEHDPDQAVKRQVHFIFSPLQLKRSSANAVGATRAAWNNTAVVTAVMAVGMPSTSLGCAAFQSMAMQIELATRSFPAEEKASQSHM